MWSRCNGYRSCLIENIFAVASLAFMRHIFCMANRIFPFVKCLIRGFSGSARSALGGFALVSILVFPACAASPAADLAATFPPLSPAMTDQKIASNNDERTPVGRFVAAPMPDQDAFAPRASASTAPAVGPSMFQSKKSYRGDGFIPDSSPQISQQSKHVSLPGISLKVPLY